MPQISTSTSKVAFAARLFWWGAGVAVAIGWCLALGAGLFLLVAPLPERSRSWPELGLWGFAIVAMTWASIISMLSLVRRAQRQRSPWFSRRIQLGAFTVVVLVQLSLVAALWG